MQGDQQMGEIEHSYHAADRMQAGNREVTHLARGGEVARVPADVQSAKAREHVLLSGRGAQAVQHEQLPAPEAHRVSSERQASSISLQEYKGLKEQVQLLTTKIDTLIEERNELRHENTQLLAELKELRELKREVERRKEKDRQRKAEYREEHPEEYNAYQREYMREYMRKRRANQHQ
jgi:hypothetical protein